MGDRTCYQARVRKDDLPKFTRIVLSYEKDAHPDWDHSKWLEQWEESSDDEKKIAKKIKALEEHIPLSPAEREKDEKRLLALKEELEATSYEVSEWEANYGYWDQTQNAAKAGCVFYGSHGSGSEYGAGGFVGVGEKFYGVDMGHDGYPTVDVQDDGKLDQKDLENVREYLKARKVVRTEFGEETYE